MSDSGLFLRRHLLARSVVRNAILVALVVGICLNAINQGSALRHGEGIEWDKVALNFLVPYLVASYSAARALARDAER